MSYHIVFTLIMKTWTSGKSWGSTSLPSSNIKFMSQARSAVSKANLRRNSTLRSNNSQSWCYWLYWSVLMTMLAVSGDAVHLAQCSMLRASPDATGRCCWVSVCNVLPGLLPWSLMLAVDRWPTKHNFQPTSYIKNQLMFFAMEWKRVTRMIWRRMFNIQCEDPMMLGYSNTKPSMLYNLLSATVALWVILDELLDKTTVQGWSAAWGQSAVLH